MNEEIQDFPRVRSADRPEVEWLKSPTMRKRTPRERDGYAVNVGDGHYVKIEDLDDLNLIIGDGSIPDA